VTGVEITLKAHTTADLERKLFPSEVGEIATPRVSAELCIPPCSVEIVQGQLISRSFSIIIAGIRLKKSYSEAFIDRFWYDG